MKSAIFLDQYKSVGGGQAVLADVIEIFNRQGWQTHAMIPMGGELERRLDVKKFISIPELHLSVGKKTFGDLLTLTRSATKLLPQLLQLKKYDVIYVNGPRLAPIIWALTPYLKPKQVIYHLHLNHTDSQKRFFLKTLLSRSTAFVIANSRFVFDELLRLSPSVSHSEKLRLISNRLRQGWGNAEFNFHYHTPLRVMCVGRISHEKGQDRVTMLAKNFPEVEFYIVGSSDFSNTDYLKDLKKNSTPNVHWSGQIADLRGFVRENNISISIMPSRAAESFGLVAVESMAASCYTIVSRVGELTNISKMTGCPSFSSDKELDQALKKALSFSKLELAAEAEKQFKLTTENYPPRHFERDIVSLIKDL